MTQSIESKIVRRISRSSVKKVFFASDFADLGSGKAINKALERLAIAGKLHRVSHGIYIQVSDRSAIFTPIPDIDEIVLSIAARDKARILPTGSYALYKLGLTTQVPLRIVYYTDGSPRKVRIGNYLVTFKKAAARRLALKGRLSKLVIQALREIGKSEASPEIIDRLKTRLKGEDPAVVEHDLALAPEWIRKLLGDGTRRLLDV